MSLPVSASQLRTILTQDPAGTLNFIITNNAEAIADNLNAIGFDYPRTLDMLQLELASLYNEGNYDNFVRALSVPLRTDKLLPEQIAVAADVAKGYLGPQSAEKTRMQGQSRIDFDDILHGLAIGYLAMTTSASSNNAGHDPAGDTGAGDGAAGGNGKQPDPDKRTTWEMIAIIGAGVLVLIGIALLVRYVRKRNKG